MSEHPMHSETPGDIEHERLRGRGSCPHCGAFLYSGPPDCPGCGAPQCCRQCCTIQNLRDERDALRAENARLVGRCRDLERLCCCYRTGQKPSEALLNKLANFRDTALGNAQEAGDANH